MDNHIVCPHCQKQIPLSDAFSHELREQLRQQAIDYAKKKDAEFKAKVKEIEEASERDRQVLKKELETATRKRIEEEMKLSLQTSQTEAEELKKRNKELSDQILELTRSMRQLQTKFEEKDLEVEKKLLEEQEKIRADIQKKAEEEFRFKLAEKDKQLEDTKRALEDAKRKSEQVSQQLQGEVLELEIEKILRQEFPSDEVKAVAKGTRGGDVLQVVRSSVGKPLGSVLWELKRTKDWSNQWIPKLKEDQRAAHAEAAVIISEILPNDINNFGWKDGVWVGTIGCIQGLAYAVRRSILEVAKVKQASEGKNEKMEILYTYIYSTEFQQRIEAVVEAFQESQSEIEREKRFFALKWARQEKTIRKAVDNAFGMRGELESITGKELGDGDNLQLDSGEEDPQSSEKNLQDVLL